MREPPTSGARAPRPRTSAFARALSESAADRFFRAEVVHPGRSGTRETQGRWRRAWWPRSRRPRPWSHAASRAPHRAPRRILAPSSRRSSRAAPIAASHRGHRRLKHCRFGSQRPLAFFSLAEDGGQAEARRDRDGHLTAAALRASSNSTSPARWRSCLSERGQADTASLHCVSVAEAAGGAVASAARRRSLFMSRPKRRRRCAHRPMKHLGNHVRPNNAARHQHFVSGSSRRTESSGHSGGRARRGRRRGRHVVRAARRAPCMVVDPRPIKATAAGPRCAAARRCPRRRAAATGCATATTRRRSARRRRERAGGGRAADAPPPPLAPAGEVAPVAGAGRAAEEAGPAVHVPPRQSLEPSTPTLSRATRGCGATARRDRHAPRRVTEPVVELALAAGKPFAVVPCCVFPSRTRTASAPTARPSGCTQSIATSRSAAARSPRPPLRSPSKRPRCGNCPKERGRARGAERPGLSRNT